MVSAEIDGWGPRRLPSPGARQPRPACRAASRIMAPANRSNSASMSTGDATGLLSLRRQQHVLPRLVLVGTARQIRLGVGLAVGPDVGTGGRIVFGHRERRRRQSGGIWCARRQLRDRLTGHGRVRVALPVVAVVERDVVLVAFAHRGSRAALAWLRLARDIAGATDVER